jgi:hypothetical protein
VHHRIPTTSGFEEGIGYRIVPSGPTPSAAETDGDARAVEVMVLWGEQSVLAVEHLPLGQGFSVGDECDARGRRLTNFLIGSDSLGARNVPVVVDEGSGPLVVVPAAASCSIASEREPRTQLTLQAGEAHPLLTPSGRMAGARQYALRREQRVCVTLGEFHFIVSEVTAARAIGTGGMPSVDTKQARWTLASFGAHAFLVFLFYLLPPASSAWSVDMLHNDPRYSRYLKVPITPPEPDPLLAPKNETDADGGKSAAGDSGAAGDRTSKQHNRKYAVRKTANATEVQMAREEMKALAANMGIVGMIRSAAASDAPTTKYGAAIAQGYDAENAIGALFGDRLGTSFGIGGLAPNGTGVGGGGPANGTVGVGDLGTKGGLGDGKYGGSAGALRSRTAKVPRITVNPPEIMGSLSKEVIRRVIGRRIAEIRYCYTQALLGRPELQGRVVVKFIISPSGVVTTAAVTSSDLGHPSTEQCIRSVVARMTFPQPEGGIVAVSYPFVLQQVGE